MSTSIRRRKLVSIWALFRNFLPLLLHAPFLSASGASPRPVAMPSAARRLRRRVLQQLSCALSSFSADCLAPLEHVAPPENTTRALKFISTSGASSIRGGYVAEGTDTRTRLLIVVCPVRGVFLVFTKNESGSQRVLYVAYLEIRRASPVSLPGGCARRLRGGIRGQCREHGKPRFFASQFLTHPRLGAVVAKVANVWLCQTTPWPAYMKTARGQYRRGRVPKSRLLSSPAKLFCTHEADVFLDILRR